MHESSSNNEDEEKWSGEVEFYDNNYCKKTEKNSEFTESAIIGST